MQGKVPCFENILSPLFSLNFFLQQLSQNGTLNLMGLQNILTPDCHA